MVIIENAYAATPRGLQHCSIVVEGPAIAEVVPSGVPLNVAPGSIRVDARGRLTLPGFVDLHLHGAGGIDVMEGNPQALERLAVLLARWGVTSFCPTTISAAPEAVRRAVEAVAWAVVRSQEEGWPGAKVVGSHCEGPFLSRIRRGAQPEGALRLPDIREVEELWQASRGTLRVVTLAPELPGAIPIVRWLVAHGVVVSAGHSDASCEEALGGIRAGITQSTHTFNGMRPLSHRDPGLLCAIMNSDEVLAEVIADGCHVSPHVVRLLCRVKGIHRVVVVSDLTFLAGLPPGEYDFAGSRVLVTETGAFLNETGGLAGSVTPMNVAFRNLLDWGFSVEEAVRLTSTNAADQLGLTQRLGALHEGMDADIVILDDDGTVFATIVAGRIAYIS